MSSHHSLSNSITSCKVLTRRYLAGFNSLNHTRQAPGLPNHVAWCLGHCALTMHRAASLLDSGEIPESDFSPAHCSPSPDDPTFCYFLESIAFKSQAVDDAALYPSFERCVQIFDTACDRLAAAIESSPDAPERQVQWGGAPLTGAELVTRMVFHNGMHTGQIADLRRVLNMPSIFA